KRYLLAELLLLAVVSAFLMATWPVALVVALGAGGALLTALAVYMTVKNRQRSIGLQALSAAGLSSSSIAACLAVNGTVPPWAWWFWALHSGYFLAGILVVHARLEARKTRRGAKLIHWQAMALPHILFAAVLLWQGRSIYAGATVLSGVFHAYG